MAAEAGGNAGNTPASERTADSAWSIDWDAIPMAQLLDDPSAQAAPAPRNRPLSPGAASPPAAGKTSSKPAAKAPAAPTVSEARDSAQPAQCVPEVPAPPSAPEAAAPPPAGEAEVSLPPPAPAEGLERSGADESQPSLRERLRPFLEVDEAPGSPEAEQPAPAAPRERLRPPVHPTVGPALDDLAPPPAEPPRGVEPSPPTPPSRPAAEDIASPLPSLPPLPAQAGSATPQPAKRGRWKRRSPPAPNVPNLPQATGGRRRSRRRRARSGRLIGLIVVTGALGAGGVYLLMRNDPGRSSSSRETPAPVQGSLDAKGSAVTPAVADRPVDNRRVYPKNEAFVSSGVRFTVVPDPIAPWAREIAATDPGEGLRWQLVAVLYRNLSREPLLVEDLRLRLKDGANNVFEPVPGVGNGSDEAPQTPIVVGTLVKGHLAFKVPTDTGNLSLIIDPGPRARARVRL